MAENINEVHTGTNTVTKTENKEQATVFITSKYNVRPALYLNNELKITGGNGTFDAPYELGVSDEKGQE